MKRIAVLLILSAFFFSGCSSTKLVRTTVAKQYEFIVTLEQQQEHGLDVLKGYAQPKKIALADFEKLMGDLLYTEKVGLGTAVEQKPVFQSVEIERLAPVLVDTLAKAGANQVARFVSYNQGDALIFSLPQKTEGVLFVDSDGRLNLAFYYINAARQSSETTAIYANHSKINPLKIETSKTPITSTLPYAELHKFENGAEAPMWVVADLKKLSEEVLTAPDPVVQIAEEAAPAVTPKAVAVSAPVEKTAPVQTAEDMLRSEIKHKLKYLKELRNEELISEKDYDAEKKELLDKLN